MRVRATLGWRYKTVNSERVVSVGFNPCASRFALAIFCAVIQLWPPDRKLFMCLPDPTKPPTPAEYAVITVVIAGLLIIFGVVGLVVAFRAPPEKHELALALEHRAFLSLGIGIGIAFVYWLIRRSE